MPTGTPFDLDALDDSAPKAEQWQPSVGDAIEGALAQAAADAGLKSTDTQWCKFLKQASRYLGRLPLESFRDARRAAPKK